MLAAAIIVLREVLEAALIIGIVLAASKGVAGSRRYVASGIAAGLLGAVVVAAGADALAAMAEGMGQELFNAGILLLAVAMLGWHNVWMGRHGAEIARDMTRVGHEVAAGTRPLIVLAVVVALAVLREGAEVVLFMYGLTAGGASSTAMLAGAAVGLAGGGLAGFIVYRGLLRIPLRHLFSITGLLILLLAAGMASQAAGLLVQAGRLPALADPAWDASQWLPQSSLAGQILHALIGYQERPSAMQILFFVITLGTVFVLMRWTAKRSSAPAARPLAAALLVIAAAAAATPRPAQAAHTVYSPIVEEGERAIEFRGHRDFDSSPARDGAGQAKLEFEWAPITRWRTELLLEMEREPGADRELTEIAWENVFQLTEQGERWADLGLLAEYAHSLEDDGNDKLELGFLAQKARGRHLTTANLIVERELSGTGVTEAECAFQYRYRLAETLEPGVEWYGALGETGQWGALSSQRQQFGPAVFGTVRGAGSKFRYEAAVLFGMTGESPATTLRLQLEYEF